MGRTGSDADSPGGKRVPAASAGRLQLGAPRAVRRRRVLCRQPEEAPCLLLASVQGQESILSLDRPLQSTHALTPALRSWAQRTLSCRAHYKENAGLLRGNSRGIPAVAEGLGKRLLWPQQSIQPAKGTCLFHRGAHRPGPRSSLLRERPNLHG